VDLTKQIFGDLDGCKIMIIGAGETSERTAKAFRSRGAEQVFVSNRSFERARAWAAITGGRAIHFDLAVRKQESEKCHQPIEHHVQDFQRWIDRTQSSNFPSMVFELPPALNCARPQSAERRFMSGCLENPVDDVLDPSFWGGSGRGANGWPNRGGVTCNSNCTALFIGLHSTC
jgi:Shikimate / quinate 5-dehydrogenase